MAIPKEKAPIDISALRRASSEESKRDQTNRFHIRREDDFRTDEQKSEQEAQRKDSSTLYRLKPFLDSGNLETVYQAFVRSSLGYGNLEYMVGVPVHLQKLDRIQAATEKLGGFKLDNWNLRNQGEVHLS